LLNAATSGVKKIQSHAKPGADFSTFKVRSSDVSRPKLQIAGLVREKESLKSFQVFIKLIKCG